MINLTNTVVVTVETASQIKTGKPGVGWGGGGGSWGSDEPPTRCRDPPSKDRQLICGASAWLSLWSDVSGDSLET